MMKNKCTACKGEGWIDRVQDNYWDMGSRMRSKQGSIGILTGRCGKCKGRGYTDES